MGKIRAGYRLLVFVVCTLVMLILYVVTGFGVKDRVRHGILWRQRWISRVPQWMGIRMQVHKLVLPTEAAIYMCNHRSYLDPVIALSQVAAVVIAKKEVARWPLIGLAARVAGVIFVKRDDVGSRKQVLAGMLEAISAGLPVLNFPEGTTTRAPELASFRPGAFQLAAQQGIPVVPVTIEYVVADDAWIDDDTFLRHFFQVFGRRRIHVYVCYGPVLRSRDPYWLRSETRARIRHVLDRLGRQIVQK